MRTRLLLLTALLVCLAGATALQAAGLVKNAEFVTRAEGNLNWPADWSADPAVMRLYTNVNDDGAADKDSLHYRAAAGVEGGAVTQTVTLAKDTDYVLSAAFKSDGKIKPMVRLSGPGGPLATVTSDGSTTWKTLTSRFNSGAGGQAEVAIDRPTRAAAARQRRLPGARYLATARLCARADTSIQPQRWLPADGGACTPNQADCPPQSLRRRSRSRYGRPCAPVGKGTHAPHARERFHRDEALGLVPPPGRRPQRQRGGATRPRPTDAAGSTRGGHAPRTAPLGRPRHALLSRPHHPHRARLGAGR